MNHSRYLPKMCLEENSNVVYMTAATVSVLHYSNHKPIISNNTGVISVHVNTLCDSKKQDTKELNVPYFSALSFPLPGSQVQLVTVKDLRNSSP